jgi:hypothetical protein
VAFYFALLACSLFAKVASMLGYQIPLVAFLMRTIKPSHANFETPLRE